MLRNADLEQFTGTQSYAKYLGGLVLTDGVRYLAEKGGCFWFLDIIASYQNAARRDPMLKEMQFWTLKVNADKTAVVICERDTDNVAFKQELKYTDFPLSEVKVWVELGSVDGIHPAYVAMLPSER